MKPTHNTPRHRHFVAAPLMALALAVIAGLNAALPVRAELGATVGEGMVTADKTSQQFSTPAGVIAVLEPQSGVALSENGERMRLLHGSMLVKASGVLEIDAGLGVTVTAVKSSLFVLRDDASTTIIPLTQFAVVTHDRSLVIAPAGKQLRFGADGVSRSTPVPDSWFSERLAEANGLTGGASAPLSDKQQTLLAAIESSDDFTRAKAVQSLSADDRTTLVASILGAEDALSSAATAAALHIAATGGNDLHTAVALRLVAENGRMDTEAAAMVADELAGIFEPPVFVATVPSLAASMLRPLPSSLIDRWSTETLRLAVTDAHVVVAALHGAINGLPQTYEDAGYPAQAELWRTAILGLSESLRPVLKGDDARTFAADAAQALAPRSALTAPPAVISSSEPADIKPQFTDDQLVAFARSTMLAHDVLFSTNTLIAPSPGERDCARVTGVFLPENGRDTPYVFSVCAADKTVRSIERDGVRLPNAVPIDTFFHD